MSVVHSIWRLAVQAATARNRRATLARLASLGSMVRRTGTALRMSSAGVVRELLRILSAEGMTQPDECLLLTTLAAEARGGDIVEIGSYRGRSTIALAIGLSRGASTMVHAVEPHATFIGESGASFGPQDRTAFLRNIEHAGVATRIRLVSLTSQAAAKEWRGPIGLLWIDGDHRYEAVRADFDAWSPHLAPGSPICLDDSKGLGGPRQVVQEEVAAGRYEVAETVGKITVLRKDAGTVRSAFLGLGGERHRG